MVIVIMSMEGLGDIARLPGAVKQAYCYHLIPFIVNGLFCIIFVIQSNPTLWNSTSAA